MHIAYTDRVFHEEGSAVSIRKEFAKDISLFGHVVFLTDTFQEYQRDIFEEFRGELVDLLSKEGVGFMQTKKDFEKLLQQLNEKLQVFASKIKDVEHFQIKGVIQIIVGNEYLASLIGSVGLVILRKDKLQYMLSNQSNSTPPIDQFSEFIEGEVRTNDKLLIFGVPVDSFLDKDDIDTILSMSVTEDKLLLDAFWEILQVRLSEKELSFMLEYHIESNVALAQKKLKSKFSGPLNKVSSLVGGFERFQALTAYALIGVVILVLMYWMIQSFQKANEASFVDDEGGVIINVTIEDIQKDIALFKKIEPSSDQKIQKYNEILGKLDLLETNNRWTYDVAELRKILESEYYKGFNIILANKETFFTEPVYEFSQLEKNTFGLPQQVLYRDGLQIAGAEGVLLGAINNEIRGTLISAGIDKKLRKCSFNLLKNGLYCITDDNQLYNMVKQGVQPMTTIEGAFPTNLRDVGTFGSSNMYVLTSDDYLAETNTYVVRYGNQLGTQENFGEGLEYSLAPSEDGSYAFASSGFGSFTIDGTFLVRSPTARSLYQLRRPGATPMLQYREIALEGGDTVEPYSSVTKVISFADSRFVYLFDPQYQTFTVYRSLPYKTNDANTTSYRLSYFFRIKFSLSDVDVIDAFVDEGEKSSLYLLTANGVFQLKLHEYIEQYFAKEAQEAEAE